MLDKVGIQPPYIIIAPHADDELIGCHQLLSGCCGESAIFYCGFLGGNYNEENRRLRESEIRKYAEKQRCRLIVSSPENLVNDLEQAVTDIHPATILVPSFVDWHPEHRQSNSILYTVIEKLGYQGLVGWYHVSLPIPASVANSMSLMSKESHRNKWKMMEACYPSQLHMDIKRFRFVERQVGGGQYAAETYYLQPADDWKQSVNALRQEEGAMNDMKQTLGQMDQMYLKPLGYYQLMQ